MVLISRRALTACAIVAPFLNLRGAYGQAKRKVTFTLPFLAEGSSSYVYVAKANGYWDELGLDVQISRGYGSVVAAQAISAGQFQFGLAAGSSAIQQSAKGLQLVALACCGYDATMGICIPKNSPIRAPKDLVGKKMASTIGSGEYPFLPIFAQRAGFDIKDVDIVQADPNVRQRLLIGGQVDALSGFAVSFIPSLLAQNVEARSLLYSQYGLTIYNNTLLTHPNILRDERKLCSDITTGLLKALKFTMLEPDAAVKLFLKQVPEMALSPVAAAQVRMGMGIFSVTMLRDPAFQQGIGYAVPEDYETMTDLVMKYVAASSDTRPKVSELFTNAFIGSERFTADEWKSAQATAEPSRRYLE